ncbi:receptor-like serine/threonine-protein kinase ALE2 isoform X1 [Lactuca sativa]|uniref:receptor-like serine/threonine-protein kinase ALE2 isoform X1 n=1 Tax=Lactuca sativa TaxID=4236 RepID=UPI000CD8B05B|nr:receptor-like serine/threonine-protein kinase ALE2 isoform X1 [Lactuca sativa]
MSTTVMLLFIFPLLTLGSPTVSYGIPFLNINLSPSLLPSQPLFVRKHDFEHLKVRFMSMSATIPSIASHIHPPVAFTKPSNVPAAPSPSPTIQGPVASPPVGSSRRRHHHHFRNGKITHAVSPSPSPVPGCDQTCSEPLTSTPIGSPCGCVFPMKVRLLLQVSVYAVFPVVNELEIEIATGTYLTQSQVVITGASADSQNQEKTAVDINLVPLGEKFDNTTALLTYDKIWRKKLSLNRTLFGDYEVVYITYPGLPSSPPYGDGDHPGSGPNGSPGNRQIPLTATFVGKSQSMNPKTIFVITLSAVVLLVVCLAAISVFLKYRRVGRSSNAVGPVFTTPSSKRRVGLGAMLSGDPYSNSTLSIVSAMPTSLLSVKTFTLAELDKATEKFSSKKILGEGGFGCVYHGIIEDGSEVAVKLLNRDNNQNGDREFIAEVEMLSRLHHRNLVKLIGICIEGRTRCLVYELVPNGSVESHLHGVDKERGPLDWDGRLKIALGAARGLAYLHEDSNPRVIHRDFKASNVLLEDDFTPKVSDFGLAREATEGSSHISTRVMGTFGYVAPEYAMTGHLLVKSDVYSYGVVLLELLSGRKPVDMSQPPGEENLVTWARPLLTTREGLQQLVDPSLFGTYDFDDMAKVAAIASMCVHPEVTQRPFMGEVVQALKLIYNDKDEVCGDSTTQRDSSVVESDFKGGDQVPSDSSWWNAGGGATPRLTYGQTSSFMTMDYSSGPLEEMDNRAFSASSFDGGVGLGSSISHGNRSGPLRTVRSKPLFYRSKGSMSEHGGLLSKPFWSEASF